MDPFEPLELVQRLNRHIDLAMHHHRRYDAYYSGKNVLAALPESVRKDCGDRLPQIKLNFARLIVDSLEERIDVAGFRHEDDAVSEEIWRDYWQANDLDEVSQQIHLEALIHGRAYAMCWVGKDGRPRITGESSRQVTVWQMPGSSHRIAALRRWIEPDGHAFATLFEPHRITKWTTPSKVSLDPYLSPEALMNPSYDAYSMWDWSQLPSTGWEARGPDHEVPNPLGVVPIVPFVNSRRLMNPAGESELEKAIPIIDAVNKLATDLMVSSEFSSMPRRYATNIEVQTKVNPVTGEEEVVDPFSRLAGRVWMAEGDTKFGQFPEANLNGYLDSIMALIKHLASICGTPQHYLGLTGAPMSADAVRSTEAALVRKAQRKQRIFGGAWEEIIALADIIRHGYRRPGMDRLECVWADPESRTIAQQADAATKLAGIGFPREQLAEDLNYSPQEIQRMHFAPMTNGARPPDAPETQREIRRSNDAAR